MNIIIMGPPGAGKGTQSAKIIEEYKIPHISTGDMFRAAMKDKTPMGIEAQKYVDQGELVPDSVTNEIVRERLAQYDCENGFLLDGFPRNPDQAAALDVMLAEKGRKIDVVLNIDVPTDLLTERLTGRRVCRNCGATYHIVYNPPKVDGVCDVCGGELYQRSDDTEEKITTRLSLYFAETKPVIDYYQKNGILRTVDGTLGMEHVYEAIQSILGGGNK
ncbi:adenylate kinase [Culicoidibacter larvae]|uniref:Adenylate kinase n=1 Tax=Culicoidibacter larvae TaxID=2579976 RepID=A0A5R8QJ96_9FIRM|nr:adenylate kinase [Culicoidibacter larvae]TLG77523.1 adenylate kinase [Culicoidibacter larvae]